MKKAIKGEKMELLGISGHLMVVVLCLTIIQVTCNTPEEPPPTLHSGIISISVLPMSKPESTGGKGKRDEIQKRHRQDKAMWIDEPKDANDDHPNRIPMDFGHEIKARADPAAPTTTTSTTTSSTPPAQSDCGLQLTGLKPGDTGNITSPNYPADYPPSVKCAWWFQSEKGSGVRLTCDDVYTQSCDSGLYDYLLIAPNWAYENYTLICGLNVSLPFMMLSTTEQLSVFFRTSLKNEFRGFRCSWKVESFTTPKPTTTTTTTTSTTTKATTTTTTTTTKKVVTTTTKKKPTTTTTVPPTLPPDSYNGDSFCGRPAIDTRIVGGQVAIPHEFPWMVGLSFNYTWFCGGTLISPEWVLTAAHCTHNAVSAYAYIGAHDLFTIEEGRMVMFSDTFVEHPEYKTDQISNDIALVKLPKKISYSDQIRPACLPVKASADVNLAGYTMIATGWGKTNDNASISPVLNKLNVTIVTKERCRQSYGDVIKDSNICAMAVAGQGTCQGDSGSSLQYEFQSGLWIQEGIVSFGSSSGCGSTPPSGYSRIAYYLDFIANVTGMTFK